VTGCTKVSIGCKFCYAERITERWGQKFTEIKLHPDRLDQPLRWRRPRRIFVNSMSDLFHESIPPIFIRLVWDRMAKCPQHTFQILTKRAQLMYKTLAGNTLFCLVDPLPNVWLGVSVENQEQADKRIPLLLETPAAVRFLSVEPLLGPVDLRHHLGLARDRYEAEAYSTYGTPHGGKISWVIVGGESAGPGGRALVEREWYVGPDDLTHSRWKPKTEALKWVREIRDQCVAAGVPFLLKQWGGPLPKSGGRVLDGRTWDEYPSVA
jgi:protein gp37